MLQGFLYPREGFMVYAWNISEFLKLELINVEMHYSGNYTILRIAYICYNV